jgi:PAS domain S-box-containing protein
MISKNNIVLNYSLDLLFKKIETNQRMFLAHEIDNEIDAEMRTRQYIIGGNIIALLLILASFLVARKQNLQKQIESGIRIEKEKELRSKQKELEALMNIMPVGVYYVDNSKNCTYVNDTWCEMTGFSAGEVYGTDLFNIIHPEDRERTFNSFMKAIEAGKNYHDEYSYVCKNGEIKHVIGQATSRKDSDGKITGFIGSVIDTTKQHIYQEELIKYNTLFESIAEGIPDPIFVKDINGYYEFINTAGAKTIGKNVEDFIGKNDFDVYSEPIAKEILEKDRLVYSGNGNINYEISSVMPDGLIKTFLTTKGLIHNSANKPIGLFGILRDITKIKENEKRITRTLTEKETLLRETHHRVKNNLQIVASLLSLQSGYIKDSESKHFFQDSQNRIKTIAALHEKLYGSEKYSHVDLKKYVEQLMEILVTSFGIDKSLVKITTEIENIDIDIEYSVPIGLVINEIITNSFKYAFPAGSKGEIFVNISKNGNELSMEIGDNGNGLNEELDIANLKSLGLQLIFTLIEGQLSGKVSFIPSEKGLVFGIKIPMKTAVLKEI